MKILNFFKKAYDFNKIAETSVYQNCIVFATSIAASLVSLYPVGMMWSSEYLTSGITRMCLVKSAVSDHTEIQRRKLFFDLPGVTSTGYLIPASDLT